MSYSPRTILHHGLTHSHNIDVFLLLIPALRCAHFCSVYRFAWISLRTVRAVHEWAPPDRRKQHNALYPLLRYTTVSNGNPVTSIRFNSGFVALCTETEILRLPCPRRCLGACVPASCRLSYLYQRTCFPMHKATLRGRFHDRQRPTIRNSVFWRTYVEQFGLAALSHFGVHH